MQLTKDWTATLDDYIIDLAWSGSDAVLAAASAGGPIAVITRDGKTRTDLPGHESGTNVIAFGEALLASGGQDGAVKLWDPAAASPVATTALGKSWVEHLAWKPAAGGTTRDAFLVAATGRDTLAIGATGDIRHRFDPAAKTVTALSWDPRGGAFARAFFGAVQIFEAGGFGKTQEFAYANGIHSLAWSPDGRWLVSGNQDPSVHLWIPDDGSELHMSGYETKVKHLAFDHTSRWLATSGGRDGCVWDCSGPGPEGREPAMVPHESPICALAFQHSHGLLATASQDGAVMIWSPERQQPLRATVKMPIAATKLAWSHDDSQLAIGTEKGALYVLKAG